MSEVAARNLKLTMEKVDFRNFTVKVCTAKILCELCTSNFWKNPFRP